MKDLLSKQERAALEHHENYDQVPINQEPLAVVRRLVERELLSRYKGDRERPGLGYIEITERGLTALRGGEWKVEEGA
jgi:hypothetical protein